MVFFPANCVAVQFESNGTTKLYVGTDIGVYYGLEQAPVFIRWGTNLPVTCVNDIEIIPSKQTLRVGTFGRGVWETNLNDCGAIETFVINVDGETAICNRDSVRLYVQSPNQNDILWSNDRVGNETWVKSAGDYYAISNSKSDCIKLSNSITITTKQANLLNVSTNRSTEMCIGDSVTLTAAGGFILDSYKWNTGTTGRNLVVTQAGKYFVSATNLTSDCISTSDTIIVTTFQRPTTPTITFIPESIDRPTKYDTLEASDGMQYQWYRNANAMANGKSKRLVLLRAESTEAEYSVTIANEGDCFSNKSAVHNYVSIKEENDYSENTINISPNPANNIINVELKEEKYFGGYSVLVVDATGKTIKDYQSISFNGNIKTFDISFLPTGTYFLKLVSDKYSLTKSFVKTDK